MPYILPKLSCKKQHCDDNIVDTVISVDDTWQKCGFTSLNGAVAARSIETGCILDVATDNVKLTFAGGWVLCSDVIFVAKINFLIHVNYFFMRIIRTFLTHPWSVVRVLYISSFVYTNN